MSAVPADTTTSPAADSVNATAALTHVMTGRASVTDVETTPLVPTVIGEGIQKEL